MKYLVFFLFSLLLYPSPSHAGFEPYFASIKSSKANVRTGPNVRYPVKWIFIKRNEPVEIVGKFEQWRKIRDKSGDEGWLHTSMISSHRHVIILGNSMLPMYSNSDDNSNIIASIEPEVRARLKSCDKRWCQIMVDNLKGWILRKNLWGLYMGEELR